MTELGGRLVDALTPFASMAKNYVGFDGARIIEVPVTIDELRAAESALTAAPPAQSPR